VILPRLALVTGAQRGIGSAIARALSNDGCDVVVNDIHTDVPGEEFARRWHTSQQVLSIAADVADEAAVDTMFEQVVDHFGRAPSVLVNNAAVQFWAPLLELTLVQWEQTLRVNLTGSFLMTQRFARCYADRLAPEAATAIKTTAGDVNTSPVDPPQIRASVINIGSGCNHLAFPDLVSYTASKGGIEMLTKVSALELGCCGIRVNCVAPGSIQTERTRQETKSYAEQWAPLTPLGRVGEVDDVARAVVFLASDASEFVSGQTLGVDGGLFSQAIWPSTY
jgi:NAD(P)-dependent dehydrogenase (short-subunit alcohol dehydrogenase family)